MIHVEKCLHAYIYLHIYIYTYTCMLLTKGSLEELVQIKNMVQCQFDITCVYIYMYIYTYIYAFINH